MTNVIMSPNPKRVKVFIKNGQVYKGSIDEIFNPQGGTGEADRVPENDGGDGETKKV